MLELITSSMFEPLLELSPAGGVSATRSRHGNGTASLTVSHMFYSRPQGASGLPML